MGDSFGGVCISLAIAPTLCQKDRTPAAAIHGETVGLLWGFSGTRERRKMQLNQLLSFGPYRLDPAHGQLWRGTQEVRLPPKGVIVLCQLVQQAGQVVTKAELFRAGWP